jgi:hypothetical protein
VNVSKPDTTAPGISLIINDLTTGIGIELPLPSHVYNREEGLVFSIAPGFHRGLFFGRPPA